MKGRLLHLGLVNAAALVAVLVPSRSQARQDLELICSDGSLTIEYDKGFVKDSDGEFPATIYDRAIEWSDSGTQFSLDRSTWKLTIKSSDQTKFAQCTPRR
ncbi:MAG TPA: hypothetical protein VLX09_22460 [Stellaceae bacterium]|nr:hypothetical protein [Stellaceae bacterium]